MTRYPIVLDARKGARKTSRQEAMDRAYQLARGDYQRNLVRGLARFSGFDLKGKARNYSASYARSRAAFLARCRAARIPYRVERRERGLLVIVWGR